ncbi:choline-sulfatase [Xylophilus sp.]|uniref:choline-sulfatase n=1 Tax=Xylophilus sp. TaxID=2653893 RepID=UPI0013B95C38|nr:choline-sulfatase [Xylophilus sp.]KAF1046749.1 MAG: Choline-sulfatase [Xylophilus sp.]
MPAPAPHILLLADQLTPRALSAYGNRVTRTPHIDRLAAGGVVFDAAYCPSPLCAPSRYGLLAGRLPSRFGGFDNASEMPSEVPTIAHHLRARGWRTILSGKMHFGGPNQLHGFEERLTTDIYPADFGWTPDWSQPGVREPWYHNPASIEQAGTCIRSNQLDFDDEVVFRARRKLFEIARSGTQQPFFLTVSLTHPHDPYAITEPYWNLYRDEDIDLPRVPQSAVADDPHSRRIRAACLLDRRPPTAQQVRNARRAYYGAISYVDDQIGTLLHTLEQTGQAADTIVVLASDHGDMLGERGLWYKMSFFEGAARVPLIVHAPARFAPQRVASAVSTIDLLPTLDALAAGGGAPGPAAADVEGRSLLPHLRGEAGGHDEAFAEYLGEGAIAPLVMIRRGRFKYIHSPADPDLLLDLAADPDELYNLAADPAQAARVAAFRAEAAAHWDLPALHRRVLESQRQRRLVFQAEARGRVASWDYQPVEDASRQYVRRHLDLDTIEAQARYPAVPPAVPAA